MLIRSIETHRQTVPLVQPFKTALRTVTKAESVIVKITADTGAVGWGEAPPTVVITGESIESIEAAIRHTIAPPLIGKEVTALEEIMTLLHGVMVGNSSAKAAVDMAVYDLFAQHCGLPLYRLLGGYRNQVETDYTVSVNDPRKMGEDALQYVKDGFNILKVKVGKDDIKKDVERIQEIRHLVGEDIKIRLDANQGWEAKEAVHAIHRMEDSGLNIELVEQPVKAYDIEGLKTVKEAVETPVVADESVFSTLQAFEVLKMRAADSINIKLMKAGGIYKAEAINKMAQECGVSCMVGSMIESRLSVTASVHFAASKKNITRYDFDAPLMLSNDTVKGGVMYDGRLITIPDTPGLGITDVINTEGVMTDERNGH